VLKSKLLRILILALVLTLLSAACGKSEGEGTQTTETTAAGGISEIRFVFAPDPAWDWVKDQGILEEMEAASPGYRIVQNTTWDEIGLFAGGHADIVSIASYETPIIESEQGIKTVTFGKYNMAKDIVIVSNEHPDWNTFADLPVGCKVGVESFTGGSTIWQAIASDLYGREMREGSSDLPLSTGDYQILPTLVENGDVCAATVDPTQVISALAQGNVRAMFGGKGGSQMYDEAYNHPGHQGMNSNNFVALKSWYEGHPGEIAFFLKVWQRALDEWQANRDAIIDAYPQHFAVATPEETQWMKEYFTNTFDWFVKSVYMDKEWITIEQGAIDILKKAGIVPDDAKSPIYVCIDPATGQETCRLPEGS
jgi:ABC-type nitrate/sulfonate/bicarbonate transport system substrate-binding protein